MDQSSILYTKCDFPVARQNLSRLAPVHDWKTGLYHFEGPYFFGGKHAPWTL